MTEMVPELILIITASYAGSVGYGDVYQCRIEKVLAGTLKEPAIRVSVLPADKQRAQLFAANPPPAKIEIGFAMLRRNEPYQMAPISGFVDQDRTSWQIVYVKGV